MPRGVTLYRFFDAEHRLLYVGITGKKAARWAGHRSKVWWSEAVTVALEHFDDRPSALAAEAHAIRTERPVHNVVHNARCNGPEDPGLDQLVYEIKRHYGWDTTQARDLARVLLRPGRVRNVLAKMAADWGVDMSVFLTDTGSDQ